MCQVARAASLRGFARLTLRAGADFAALPARVSAGTRRPSIFAAERRRSCGRGALRLFEEFLWRVVSCIHTVLYSRMAWWRGIFTIHCAWSSRGSGFGGARGLSSVTRLVCGLVPGDWVSCLERVSCVYIRHVYIYNILRRYWYCRPPHLAIKSFLSGPASFPRTLVRARTAVSAGGLGRWPGGREAARVAA